MRRTGYEMKIVVSAIITEDGTGVELSGEGSSEIRTELAKVTFLHLDSDFKRGIPLYGEVLLKDVAGKPMSNETVVVYVNYDGTNFTYTTGKEGTADFSLDTTNFTESSVQLRVKYRTTEHCYSGAWLTPSYGEDSRSIKHYYSRSKSYIKIQPSYQMLQCDHSERITVHYILTPEGVGETQNAEFHYVVMAKGSLVSTGKHAVGTVANHESHGDFTFDLNAGTSISPKARVLVYVVLDSGEVIADSITFNVEKCFENKVQMSFEPAEALPGSQTNLKFHAAKESLCAVKAIDESVLLLKPEAALSAQTVYDLLPVQDLTGYYHNGRFLEEPREDPCLDLKPIFMNGVYYTPTSPEWDTDAYFLFKDLGLKVFTNTNIRTPTLCAERVQIVSVSRGTVEASPMAFETSARLYKADMDIHDAVIETVRSYFPETWIWDLCETDEHGQAVVPLTVPDTITTWKAQSFCTSQESGFGLSNTVSLVTFQPFFLDLTVLYSAIRGEKFTLKATVFNYLSQTIRVRILLMKSDHFVATAKNIEMEEYCVKANRQVTVSWNVVLTTLGEVEFTVSAETLTGEGLCDNEIVNPTQGRKDTITKHILVEPEGIEREETKNVMICLKDSNEINELIPVDLPEHVVEGSARAYFSVIGDIMGTAMQNLGSLLQMPFGCGEQNMVLFTPNIYILDYLNNTKQLTPEIKLKAKNYLTSGYQKQLAYKHSDGSYSAFGHSDREGNTWLTAFVMKSFSRARNHIYIEEKLIQDALTWLSLQQKANGCFRSSGTLFNNAMKGGVDDEITLASYITIALLESHLPLTHPVVRNALFCLESRISADNSIYTKALMAYVFTLAGKMDIRSQLLQSLKEQAIEKDGTVHWHRKEFSEDSELRQNPYQRAPSVEIEMTSYVLLSFLSKPHVSDEEMTYSTSIVSWIIKQQNPTGGFSSTQDTVVALQALALFGFLTVSHDASRKVVLNLGNSPVHEFHVEDSNRLLLQRVALPEIPGKYAAGITGPGCVYLKRTLKYNVPHPKGDAAFSISVNPEPEVCDPKSLKSFSIAVNVSYDGNRESSNMAIVEIKLPSGYIPIKSSVKQLTGRGLIKRTESQPDKVIVYFESLTNVTQSFKFLVEQDIHVGNLQPATALIYDYYEKDEFAVTKYSAPCSSKDDESNE
ncbi:alpha-2-macroglobulin-like [Rhinophrynus dorsalis]